MAKKMSFKDKKYNEIIEDLQAKNARLERELSDGRSDFARAQRVISVMAGTPFNQSIEFLNLLVDVSGPATVKNVLRTAVNHLIVADDARNAFPGMDDSEYNMSADRFNTVIRGL